MADWEESEAEESLDTQVLVSQDDEGTVELDKDSLARRLSDEDSSAESDVPRTERPTVRLPRVSERSDEATRSENSRESGESAQLENGPTIPMPKVSDDTTNSYSVPDQLLERSRAETADRQKFQTLDIPMEAIEPLEDERKASREISAEEAEETVENRTLIEREARIREDGTLVLTDLDMAPGTRVRLVLTRVD